MTKECPSCGKVKPFEDFGLARRRPDGLQWQCKSCSRAAAKEWRLANPEKYAAKLRREGERRKENPDRYARYWREWARRCPPEAVAARRQRARDHQRARRGASPESAAYLRVVCADPCAYCGGSGGTWDHIDPADSGGSHGWQNATGACLSCNSAKQAKPLLAFLLYRTQQDHPTNQRATVPAQQ